MGFLFRVYFLGFTPQTGGISFSGKTLNVTGHAQVRFRLACQPCNCYLLPVNGFHHKPPLYKGRWHFREKMTEGLSRKSALSLPANFSKRHNPSPASQELPLHKGAFPIMAPSTESPHPLFLFTGNSLLKGRPRPKPPLLLLTIAE